MLKAMVIAASLVLVMGACGSDDGGGTGAGDAPAASDAGSFGEAAAAGEADRTVKVDALDDLSFEPASVTVEAGETINFVVTNEGKAPHEFVIGDREYQDEHEQSMEHGGGHGGEDLGNVIELPPGATEEIAWTFTDAGEVLFACHVEGHYEGGMVGSVNVQ